MNVDVKVILDSIFIISLLCDGGLDLMYIPQLLTDLECLIQTNLVLSKFPIQMKRIFGQATMIYIRIQSKHDKYWKKWLKICMYIWCESASHTYSFNARKILQIQKNICNYCKRFVVPWKKCFVNLCKSRKK